MDKNTNKAISRRFIGAFRVPHLQQTYLHSISDGWFGHPSLSRLACRTTAAEPVHQYGKRRPEVHGVSETL